MKLVYVTAFPKTPDGVESECRSSSQPQGNRVRFDELLCVVTGFRPARGSEMQYISLPRGAYMITYPESVEQICVLEMPKKGAGIRRLLIARPTTT